MRWMRILVNDYWIPLIEDSITFGFGCLFRSNIFVLAATCENVNRAAANNTPENNFFIFKLILKFYEMADAFLYKAIPGRK